MKEANFIGGRKEVPRYLLSFLSWCMVNLTKYPILPSREFDWRNWGW